MNTEVHFDITCHSRFQEEVNCNTDLSVKAAVKFQKRIAELTVAVAAAHHNYLPTPYFPNILVALTMTCFAMQQRQAKKKKTCVSLGSDRVTELKLGTTNSCGY